MREMDLVHSMLKAAMAEDGDEEDEVKEEYGRQMEENLAGLKEKLEEARRNEGKDPIPSRAIQEETDSKEAATGLDHHQVELGACQEKVRQSPSNLSLGVMANVVEDFFVGARNCCYPGQDATDQRRGSTKFTRYGTCTKRASTGPYIGNERNDR